MGVTPERFAVMSVDPGTTSGLAWGWVEVEDSGMLIASMQKAVGAGLIRSREVRGPAWEQASSLSDAWQDFYAESKIGGYGIVELTIEDFILRTSVMERSALDPVRVTSAFLARIAHTWGAGLPRPIYQQPSEAKSISSARLRAMGLWVRGSEHERDARRHLATRADRLLG